MPIESQVQIISDLDPKYPATDDPVSQGDNHLRNIKTALVNTFPNVDAPVTATDEELNQLVGKDFAQDISDLDDRVTQNEADIAEGQQDREAIHNQLDTLENEFDNHTINSHDVDTSRLEPGAILLWDGSQWISKKLPLGGGMVKMIAQPRDAGNFSYEPGEQRYLGSISSGGTLTLTVPANMVFSLWYFTGYANGSTLEMDPKYIIIDGVNVSADSRYASRLDFAAGTGSLDTNPAWPAHQRNGFQPIRVDDSLTIKSKSGSGEIAIYGVFTEAEV